HKSHAKQHRKQQRTDDDNQRCADAPRFAFGAGQNVGVYEFHAVIFPSSRRTIRSAQAATRGSCVTIIMVVPRWSRMVCNSSIMASLFLLSRLPVGSSASSIFGLLT